MRSNLSAAEQVVYLRDEKDVTFNYMSEEAVEHFLADRNYFFKLKAFAKNYDKRFMDGEAKGRYIGLDFAYLVELSWIDKQLRGFVLDLTLALSITSKFALTEALWLRAVILATLPRAILLTRTRMLLRTRSPRWTLALRWNLFSQMRLLLGRLDKNDDQRSMVVLANELSDLLCAVTMDRTQPC